MRIDKTLILAAFVGAALTVSGASFSQSEPPATRGLYENLDVLGVLDCEVTKDIHLIVGADTFLRCVYTPTEGYDVLRQYSGYVRGLAEAFTYLEGDYVCWNVLYLRGEETPDERADPKTGAYSSAAAAVMQEYELKPGALVGGANKTFALEPRCEPVERAGRNIADAITMFELAR